MSLCAVRLEVIRPSHKLAYVVRKLRRPMGAAELRNQSLDGGHLPTWRRQHPYLFALFWVFIFAAARLRRSLSVIFAPWPSMHDPISHLLNIAEAEEADKLTEKWTDGKLKELQYVGLSVRLLRKRPTLCDSSVSYSTHIIDTIPERPSHRHHCVRFLLVFRRGRSVEYRSMLD